MKNNLMPLYYAIIKHFMDEKEYCAQDVIDSLAPNYSNYKLLNRKDVEEALATAKENGLLEESNYDLDNEGNLRIYYRVTEFGKEMIGKYLS